MAKRLEGAGASRLSSGGGQIGGAEVGIVGSHKKAQQGLSHEAARHCPS